MLPVFIEQMAGALKIFGSFSTTCRSTKLLCFVVYSTLGSCLVEIPFRSRNYIYYIIGRIGNIKSLLTLRVQWQNSTYVTGVIP